MNTVAQLFPAECIEVITTGSPKSLVFMVDEDSRALVAQDHPSGRDRRVHRRVRHRGQPFGRAGARIADQRPHHALRHPRRTTTASFVTRKIEVEGPISLITTSARANLDPEMENRLLEVPIDESPRATAAIQHAQLSGETRRRAKAAAPAVEELIDVPALAAIGRGGARRHSRRPAGSRSPPSAALPLTVQTRRDVPLFMCAVQACAVIHLARRKRDAEGQVIAEFEDYEVAHDAIDGFLGGGLLDDAQAAGDRRPGRDRGSDRRGPEAPQGASRRRRKPEARGVDGLSTHRKPRRGSPTTRSPRGCR